MRRRWVVGGVAATVLLLAVGGTAILLSSHRAPSRLSLGTPAPGSSQRALAGSWKVAAGSEAGYRAHEKFVNQPETTEAVARTMNVTGGLQVQGSGSTLKATSLHFSADLSTLVSQDKYANYQVYQRDFFVKTVYLESDRFPIADFKADSVSLPPEIASGPVDLTVPGRLTVRGVTKQVTTNLQAQPNGSQMEVAGSISVDMRDYGITPPDISFTQAEPGITIEYHLLLSRA